MTPEPVRFRSILLYDNFASFTSSRTEDVRQNEGKCNFSKRRKQFDDLTHIFHDSRTQLYQL